MAAISSFGRSQLMRWSDPSQWGKINVIRCGLDRDYLDQPVQPIARESDELVCVARLSAQKGLPLLIAACDRLRREDERFTVTIVGDGELRDVIEADIDRRQLGDCIHLAGTRSSAEIREFLLAARAFVLPSLAEGLPVVIMEALAMARPVITTAVAGIPELVDSECGWVVPAGDEQALAAAMKAALHASTDELGSKGSVGRERVRELHDATRNASMLAEAIAGAATIPAGA